MRELSVQEQYEIQGGSMIGSSIIYLLFGAAVYRLWRSKRGRISIPRLVQIEWGD